MLHDYELDGVVDDESNKIYNNYSIIILFQRFIIIVTVLSQPPTKNRPLLT